jgi:hypothetical protein
MLTFQATRAEISIHLLIHITVRDSIVAQRLATDYINKARLAA